MGQEIFPVMRGRAGMGQENSMRVGGEDPILRPRPAPLPSLEPTKGIVEAVNEEEDLVSKFEKMDEEDNIHTAYEKLYKVFEKH